MFPSQTLPFEARALVTEASWWESLCLELPPPPAPACREFSFSALEEELAAPSTQPKEQRSPVVLQKIFLCLRRAPVWPPAAPSQLSSLLASCLLDPELGQQAGKCPLWTGGLGLTLSSPTPRSLYSSGPPCCSPALALPCVSWVPNGMGLSWAEEAGAGGHCQKETLLLQRIQEKG